MAVLVNVTLAGLMVYITRLGGFSLLKCVKYAVQDHACNSPAI